MEEVARHVGGPVPPGIKSNPTGNVDCCCHMAAATNQTLSYRAEVLPVQGPQIHPFNPLRPGSLNKIKIKLYAPILNLLQRVILFTNMRKKGPLPKAHAVRNGRSKRVGKDNRMNFPEIICMVCMF